MNWLGKPLGGSRYEQRRSDHSTGTGFVRLHVQSICIWLITPTSWDGLGRSDILNFDNGHRQRQGQHNKRGRGRNNRRSGGGGGGGNQHGGGNSPNRVYESNGPDVKVRGTAQTIAEKYMQLGRDAHSSGDNVMAESYYQFAEHYFRVLQSALPQGQIAPQILRRPGEEAEEEVEAVESEDGAQLPEGAVEGAEPVSAGSEPEAAQAVDGAAQAERPREGDGRSDNRERFRPRWQQRRDDRNRGRDGNPRDQQGSAEGSEGGYNGHREEEAGETDGNWEAPSFLKRPAPAAAEAAPAPAEEEGERRPARARRGRPPAEDAAPATGDEE